MTSKTASQYLPLVKALAEGKTIQMKNVGGNWVDIEPTDNIGFSLELSYYRIKPEPIELVIAVSAEGRVCNAADMERFNGTNWRVIHVREVVE